MSERRMGAHLPHRRGQAQRPRSMPAEHGSSNDPATATHLGGPCGRAGAPPVVERESRTHASLARRSSRTTGALLTRRGKLNAQYLCDERQPPQRPRAAAARSLDRPRNRHTSSPPVGNPPPQRGLHGLYFSRSHAILKASSAMDEGCPRRRGFSPRKFVASRITMTSFLGAGGVALSLQAGTKAAQRRSASRTV
jgi:hypothetical protein